MDTPSVGADLLDRYLPHYAQHNRTSVDVAAPAEVVWAELHALRLDDCRLTKALFAIRGLPGRIRGRGAYGSGPGSAAAEAEADGTGTADTDSADGPLLAAMTSDRFVMLDEIEGTELVIGVVGRFWELDGGTDAPIADGSELVAFDRPGYVKAVINFTVEATGDGSRLSTETRCLATDPATARTFARYWLLVGWGSKLTRWDLLTAVRRNAERTRA